jgi:hypothetical protein
MGGGVKNVMDCCPTYPGSSGVHVVRHVFSVNLISTSTTPSLFVL